LKNWYNSNNDEVVALKEESARLKQNVDLALDVDIREQQLSAEEQRLLDRIKPPSESFFDPDSKSSCMQDTRTTLLERLRSFAVSEDKSQRVFLLSGIAGCGKSSVANSVANMLHKDGRLLGSFFFQTDSETMRIPANFLHAMAYSLAARHEQYKKALIKVLKDDKMIVEHQGPSIQFDTLLRKPFSAMLKLSSTRTFQPPSRRVIVIDALDECDDPQSVSSYLAEIVGLAPWLKVILTSRPLDDIKAHLCKAGYTTHLDLFTIDASQDILKFTQSQFAPGGPLQVLQSHVKEEDIKALADKSYSLFIWIKTVLSYIYNLPFTRQKLEELKSILSLDTAANPEKELDRLYLRVLRSVARISPEYQDAVKTFVGIIYATSRYRSLPCKGLHAFIPTPATPEDLHELRSKLAAVITIDSETEALQVCHPSFLDFVATKERSQEFWTEPGVLDTIMAERCFSLLKVGQSLKSNIWGQEANRDEIPQELRYSAVYWLDHLLHSAGASGNEKRKETWKDAYKFLDHMGLLYMLEVLNSVSEYNAAVALPQKISDVVSILGRPAYQPEGLLTCRLRHLVIGRVSCFRSPLRVLILLTLFYV
jgi:hypothetical protein